MDFKKKLLTFYAEIEYNFYVENLDSIVDDFLRNPLILPLEFHEY